jgi:hypothetical protein
MLGLALSGGAVALAEPDDDAWGNDEDDPFAEFEDEDWDDPWATRSGGLSWTGFVEGGLGSRWEDVENLDKLSLGELRLRAETRYDHGGFRVDFKGDLLWDHVIEELDTQVRELAVSFSPGPASTSSSAARS